MFFLCILDLVVRDAAEALDEEHDRRHARAGDLGRVVEGAAGQAVAENKGSLHVTEIDTD